MRSSLPTPIKSSIRNASIGVRKLIASRCHEPDFLVIGAQRCGTTSLFRALEQHPQVVRPSFNKGINYFDLNYNRGRDWYRAHFPIEHSADSSTAGPMRAFEASGYYIFHPVAPERIARDLPNVRIVAMLRDPIERAYSAWKHESARGFDDLSFEMALQTEAARTQGRRERMIRDHEYQSYAYRHYSYAARGRYSDQLMEYYDRFPSSQIHVVYSEQFFAEPVSEFARLERFLGIDHSEGISFDRHNARPSSPMPERAWSILRDAYANEARALENLVGCRPPWASIDGA